VGIKMSRVTTAMGRSFDIRIGRIALGRCFDVGAGSCGRETFVNHSKEQAEVCFIYLMGLKQSKFMYIGTGMSSLSPVVTVSITSFNAKEFYVLSTQCIYVFCVDLRTNSDYFPMQH
jgi:hypothetical protein